MADEEFDSKVSSMDQANPNKVALEKTKQLIVTPFVTPSQLLGGQTR